MVIPISKLGDEWRLQVRGHSMDVEFSLDKARQDFVKEALCRGYDADAVRQISESLAVGTLREEKSGTGAPAAVEAILAAPLRRSKVQILFSQPDMERGLEYFLKNERVSAPTKEEMELIMRNHLTKLWMHEREHLMQQFELSPDDFQDHYDTEERNETIRSRWGSACWITTIALVVFLGRELAGPLSIGELVLLSGSGAITGILVSEQVKARMAFRDYKRNRIETEAFKQMETGTCLSGIFDVSVVQLPAVHDEQRA